MFNGNFNDFNQQMRNAEKTQNRIMKFGLMMWVLWVVFLCKFNCSCWLCCCSFSFQGMVNE
jgi:hypothetical protein